ncbi:hypothetical protein [Achromobacter phage Motura]|uniref:IraD/Gp25-like domain-containing protein n=1 Tax=Achromobacter phage Motura TaxID=2591403 RepID=A0A514CT66_9CAUD|nr:hypothetical protein H1O15_gp134 [Achromobacter phage Motura]QDH83677.1 hypothetical protein [Achromobacter phage Motura]
MSAPTNFALNLSGADWIDVNTLMTQSVYPDRLPDELSITNASLINLLNCPIGARGRIFEPTYGSMIYQYLQEPIDETTAQAIQVSFIQAIAKWEPRIELDYSGTYIRPDYTIPGYHIRLAFTIVLSGAKATVDFNLAQG